MDLHTIQKLVLINLEPVLSYLHEAKVSEFCETSHGYLTSDVAKFVYMLLSIVSTYGTLAANMRARKQYNTPYLVLMTFFLYVMTQSTRSTLFGNPWKLLQSDQLLTVFLSVYVFEVKPRHRLTLHSLVYHFIFYPLKWLTRMFEKLKIFHHGNLFLTSLDSAIFLSIVFFLASICVLLITVEYPQFNTAVVAILSYNLSPLYLKLEQTIWGGAGPVIPASIGQGMLLYLLRISLDRFVPHLCENEKYMSVQAFIVVSWLILPAGFWDNLIGSLFSSVSPAWQSDFYEQQRILEEQYYQSLKTQKKTIEAIKKKND